MNRRTILTMFLAISPCLLLLQGCSKTEPVWPEKSGKKVLATFPALYCFAQIVAGDDANVMCLLSANSPHKPPWNERDVMKVRTADLVLANGLGLDDAYLERIVHSSGKSKDIKPFEVGEALDHELLIHNTGEHKHDAKDDHEHGEHDPHIWLGPDRAKAMVDIIAKQLGELEPSKKDNFLKRANDFKAKLDDLKAYGLEQFKGKKNVNIVTQHESLAYFAAEFKLKIVGHVRMQNGFDDGARESLIKACKEHKPAVFTYEPQFKKEEVEQIQESLKKAGIDTELADVDPIETAPLAEGSPNPDPGFYLERMRKNIDNLAKALK